MTCDGTIFLAVSQAEREKKVDNNLRHLQIFNLQNTHICKYVMYASLWHIYFGPSRQVKSKQVKVKSSKMILLVFGDGSGLVFYHNIFIALLNTQSRLL